MGFLNGLGRMLQGKPVFEDPNQVTQAHDSQAISSQAGDRTPTDSHGNKIIPEIRIAHCRSRINGSSMTTTAWLTNTSSVEIELDKIIVAGVRTELDRRLTAGSGHEVIVYRGPIMMNDHNQRADLQYKTVPGGDYFLARFDIEYDRQPSGTYMLEDFQPQSTIRDI